MNLLIESGPENTVALLAGSARPGLVMQLLSGLESYVFIKTVLVP